MSPAPPLTLLVAQSPIAVAAAAREWAVKLATPLLSVNDALSGKAGATSVDQIVVKLVTMSGADAVVLYEASLLFLPSLKLDPVAMLLQLSRTREIVFAWTGKFIDSRLSYAVPEHSHFRTWETPKAHIVQVG